VECSIDSRRPPCTNQRQKKKRGERENNKKQKGRRGRFEKEGKARIFGGALWLWLVAGRKKREKIPLNRCDCVEEKKGTESEKKEKKNGTCVYLVMMFIFQGGGEIRKGGRGGGKKGGQNLSSLLTLWPIEKRKKGEKGDFWRGGGMLSILSIDV